jgi:hypothetical protein
LRVPTSTRALLMLFSLVGDQMVCPAEALEP